MQQSYQKLFENNKKWVQEKLNLDPDYFNKLADGQRPKYLFIGCSDSRVPANEITGTEAGEMFIHRNIANVVVHTDINLMSVVQYAVEVLNVEHVIVCGHFGCGGVKAAMTSQTHGLIDEWLRNIKEVYRQHREIIDAIPTEEGKLQKLVEMNVRESVYRLSMSSIIQKARREDKPLQLHGWVYDIRDGLLNDLQIDIEKDFTDLDIFQYTV